MVYLIICITSFLASALTFFSGFGLGTLLLPAFTFFFTVEQAIALTAVVHFLNSIFKTFLVGRHADRGIVLRFGIPAIVASLLGAQLLMWLATVPPAYSYDAFGRTLAVTPVKLVVGVLLLFFATVEVVPRLRTMTFEQRYMSLGGLLSGFFGGLSGMQGALRSAFLTRSGLSKEVFIGTGVVIACLIDLSRLSVYYASFQKGSSNLDYGLLVAAVLAAFGGALLGNAYLKKSVTMAGIQRLVAAMLFVFAGGLIAGVI